MNFIFTVVVPSMFVLLEASMLPFKNHTIFCVMILKTIFRFVSVVFFCGAPFKVCLQEEQKLGT